MFTTINLPFGKTAVENKLPGASDATGGEGFGLLINQVLSIVLTISVIAVLFYLILGAFEWITSGGDKGKTEKARDKMTQAVIGLVILVSVVAILMFIQTLFDICILDFGGACSTVAT